MEGKVREGKSWVWAGGTAMLSNPRGDIQIKTNSGRSKGRESGGIDEKRRPRATI